MGLLADVELHKLDPLSSNRFDEANVTVANPSAGLKSCGAGRIQSIKTSPVMTSHISIKIKLATKQDSILDHFAMHSQRFVSSSSC